MMSDDAEAVSNIIDGRALAKKIEERVKERAGAFLKDVGSPPRLATVMVGEDPASQMYVRMKHRACERVGIASENANLPADAGMEGALDVIRALNSRSDVHGILVQLPLPPHLNERIVVGTVDPSKDVDGFHPMNMGNLLIGRERLVPCTPHGIIAALDEYGVELEGINAVIVGHSNVVGKPLAGMLLNRNATVTVCHVYTKDLKVHTLCADLLVVAAGVKGLVKADMVKDGVIVFDVGINTVGDKIYGDVEFDEVREKARLITPVPGGVGPMTIAMLLQHTLDAARAAEAIRRCHDGNK